MRNAYWFCLLELNIHLLKRPYVLGIVTGAGDILVNRTSKRPKLRNLNSLQWVEGGGKISKQIILNVYQHEYICSKICDEKKIE